MRPDLSKQYDHNPNHYRFRRTLDDFYPDDDNDRYAQNTIIVFAILCIVAVLVAHVVGWALL